MTNDEYPHDHLSSQLLGSPRPAKNSLPKGREGRRDVRKRTRPSGDVSVELQERDLVLLRLIDRHRLLNAEQLRAALGPGSNERAFLHRLAKLFHAGVIDRPPAQFRPGQPSRSFIYAVGPRGREVLDQLAGARRRSRNTRTANDRLKLNFLEHESACAEVALAFQLATERQGWTFELALGDEVATASGLPPGVDVSYRRDVAERLPLCPDAYVVVDAGGGARRAYLFEVDLGTEPQIRWNLRTSSILRKVIAYWQLCFWRNAPIDGVIFFARSAARLSNMIDVVRRADPKAKGSHYFQFALLDDCRIETHAALFYDPLFRSSKIGYDHPRPLFLPVCPDCNESVDVRNEPHRILGADLLAHEFCPVGIRGPGR